MSLRFSAILMVLVVGLVAGAAESEEASDAGEIGGWLAVRGEQVLAAAAPDRLLTPASVQKLVVVAAALHHLGPEFRIETEVRADGPLVEGALEGDLVVVGSADPSWNERFYEQDPLLPMRKLASDLAEKGLRRVGGRLVLDVSAFPGRRWPLSRATSEVVFGFAAPISALAIDENAVILEMKAGPELGSPAELATTDGRLEIDNRTRTVGPERHEKGTLEIRPSWDESSLVAVGEYPISEPSYRIPMSAPDAIARVGEAFRRVLGEAGIEIEGPMVVSESATKGAVMAYVSSPPLRELIVPVLRESHNWYAEMLLVVLARQVVGEGRIGEGLEALEQFMSEVVGVADGSFRPDDGSGISPYNLVTPRAVVELLRFVWRQPWRDDFVGALASPGAGSLEVWPSMPSVRAKTGTVRDTIALAGFLGDGLEPTIFAVMWNHDLAERPVQRQRIATWVRSLADR